MPERGYQNEMLDEWVGEAVLMGLMYAPELEDEEAQSMGEDPSLLKSHITQSARAPSTASWHTTRSASPYGSC